MTFAFSIILGTHPLLNVAYPLPSPCLANISLLINLLLLAIMLAVLFIL